MRTRRNPLSRALAWLLALPVHFYRRVISPLKPPTCRFDPTCSAYALEALRVHGPLRGSWLTLRRVLRCHPFGGCGHDPVPPRRGMDPEPADGAAGQEGTGEDPTAPPDRTG